MYEYQLKLEFIEQKKKQLLEEMMYQKHCKKDRDASTIEVRSPKREYASFYTSNLFILYLNIWLNFEYSRPVTAKDKLELRKFLSTKYSYSVERTDMFNRFMNLLIADQNNIYQALQREKDLDKFACKLSFSAFLLLKQWKSKMCWIQN